MVVINMEHMKICAHRGASAYAPENTMPAFELAARQKADSIEIDVHLTKDDIIVVSHDGSIDRCSDGHGDICGMTYSELKRYNFAALYPKYGFVGIPTVADVYAMAARTGLRVNVEIKGGIGRIEPLLAAVARDMNMGDRVYYCSFDLRALVNIKREDPLCSTGLLFDNAPNDVLQVCLQNRIDAVHPWRGALTEADMRSYHSAGLIVRPWVVDEREEMLELMHCGADELITNKPDIAYEVVH